MCKAIENLQKDAEDKATRELMKAQEAINAIKKENQEEIKTIKKEIKELIKAKDKEKKDALNNERIRAARVMIEGGVNFSTIVMVTMLSKRKVRELAKEMGCKLIT